MSLPKICIYDCGGSIGMEYDSKKNILREGGIISDLLRYIPELQGKFHIDIIPLFSGNSYDIQKPQWLELAEAVKDDYERYDGFVVLHGTSTLAYTASYLSFALQELSKPVVFTGAILPLKELGSEARGNIIHACMVAAMDIAEVVVVYGTDILRANRCTKSIENYSNVFASPNHTPLGEIKRPFVLFEERKRRRKRKLVYKPHLEERILSLKVTPGLTAEVLRSLMEKFSYRALILEGYGAGVLPSDFMLLLDEFVKQGIAIVIASQMEHGLATPFTSNAHTVVHSEKLIYSYDMTCEALSAKLMWALAQSKSLDRVQSLMERNIAGELNEQLVTPSSFKKY